MPYIQIAVEDKVSTYIHVRKCQVSTKYSFWHVVNWHQT